MVVSVGPPAEMGVKMGAYLTHAGPANRHRKTPAFPSFWYTHAKSLKVVFDCCQIRALLDRAWSYGRCYPTLQKRQQSSNTLATSFTEYPELVILLSIEAMHTGTSLL